MPAGRPVNCDAKINRLVGELRKALVAPEAARIDGAVASHIDGFVASLQGGVEVGGARQALLATSAASGDTPGVTATAPLAGRKRRSTASRQAQAAKMKAYWAKRTATGAKAPRKMGRYA